MVAIGELIRQVRDIIDEPSVAQWTDPMLVRWINEANRDLARETRHLKDTILMTVYDSVGTYVLPDEILTVEHAYWQAYNDTRQHPLIARHWENMDAVWGVYQDDEYPDPQFFTVLGFAPNAELRLFPIPSQMGQLSLIVARVPTELDPDDYDVTDQVETPASWYDALADYCEYKALRRDRDPRWQEARSLYLEKRDGLRHSADLMAVNSEIVPAPGVGYIDSWLTQFD